MIKFRRYPCHVIGDESVFCEFLKSTGLSIAPTYRYRVVAPWLVNDSVAQHTMVYSLADAQVLAAKARGCAVSDVAISEGELV